MTKIKIGLIGAGSYGLTQLKFIKLIDDFEFVSVCDVDDNAIKCAREIAGDNFTASNNYKDLLANKEIQAVFITTPNFMHENMVLDALDAKKAIYVEKPPSTTIEGCYRIMKKQEETGIPLMVGMQLRFGYDYRMVKEIIDSGEIGTPRMFYYKGFRNPFKPGWQNWRISKEKSGGTIIEKNVHQFDLFSWYTNSNVKRISGFGSNDVVYKNNDILDHFCVSVEYGSGACGCIAESLFSPGMNDEIQFYILGDKGVIILQNKGLRIKTQKDNDFRFIESKQKFSDIGHGGTEYDAYLAFVDYINSGKNIGAGAVEGKNSVVAAIAAEVAIAEGKVVETVNIDHE